MRKDEFLSTLKMLNFTSCGTTNIVLTHNKYDIELSVYPNKPSIFIHTTSYIEPINDYLEALEIICQKMNS